MFDFLNPKLLPKVSCDSPVTDGYEPENLISDKASKRASGFICYPSVRPPVELVFTLLCSTNLQYVVLDTTVGSHSCSGIELRVRTHPKSTNYIPVGKAFYDKRGVVFCTGRYIESDLFDESFHRALFYRNSFKFLPNVSALKVVILRTNRSVPCLASVRAWATPGKFCSETTINTLHRLMDQTHPSNPETPDNTFKIPEDFKDALTDEVMSVPMTLPSGNTIDRTTLDKHVLNEESFGRRPCDPFTGIKFTDTLKPVLNVALKSRLDTFVSRNSFQQELRDLRRTVGRITTSTIATEPVKQKDTRDKVDTSDDLEEALAAAKRSKGFVSFSEEDEPTNSCVRCSKTFQSVYELPCKHYHCRECLLVIDGLRCSKCGLNFSAAEVKRINL